MPADAAMSIPFQSSHIRKAEPGPRRAGRAAVRHSQLGGQDGVPVQEREDKGRAKKGCGSEQAAGKAEGSQGQEEAEKTVAKIAGFSSYGFLVVGEVQERTPFAGLEE